MKTFKRSLFLISALGLLGLNACGPYNTLRDETAMRIASPAWLVQRPVVADPFILTAFERMHERGAPATLYIGGRGEADTSSGGALFNATPRNPVALHLATMDKADNLAYIARPCQYSGLYAAEDGEACDEKYWGEAQFSPEVLSAYNAVLNGIKARYGVTNFNLVGYDTGATIAAALAGSRKDVVSLRSVAGHFDMDTLKGAIPSLKHVPQQHFTGGQDTISAPDNVHTYLQALGDTECAAHTMIQEAGHDKGWVNKWPELLKEKPPFCAVPVKPELDFVPIEKPKPIYSPRPEGLDK